MADKIAALLGGLLVAAIVLYLIVLAAFVLLLVASILVGALSLVIAKSTARGVLVKEHDGSRAALLSLGWGAALSLGCISGSCALLFGLSYADPKFWSTFQQNYGDVYDFDGLLLASTVWLLTDAVQFCLKTALALYVANRVYVARETGGRAWYGVFPPILAAAAYFIGDNWPDVTRFIMTFDHTALQSLQTNAEAVVKIPIALFFKLFTDPHYVVTWCLEAIKSAHASMFRLARVMPTLFLLLALAFAFGAIVRRNPVEAGSA